MSHQNVYYPIPLSVCVFGPNEFSICFEIASHLVVEVKPLCKAALMSYVTFVLNEAVVPFEVCLAINTKRQRCGVSTFT